MIPYGRQDVTPADIDAVTAVLRSDFLTQGPVVPRFEQAVAAYCGAAHAVAANSATAALHIACLALGLGEGDWLWTSPNTFIASANCALYCGAQVDFVDIDPRTYNLDAQALAAKLRQASHDGRLPKIVIPVHFAGQSCDMRAIHDLARNYGFRIIEDASHAIGGRYRDTPIGNCAYSDITVFSFHPVKIITAGEGGMAMTNDAGLAERMQRFRTHGVTRDPRRMQRVPDGAWYYEQLDLGLNYRMTDIAAALGLSQFSRIDEYVGKRRALSASYDAAWADLPLVLPFQHPQTFSATHLYVIKVDAGRSPIDRRTLFQGLSAAGIGTNVHYIPVHTQPLYRARGFARGDFPEAEGYYEQAITVPLFAALGEDDHARVVEATRRLLS